MDHRPVMPVCGRVVAAHGAEKNIFIFFHSFYPFYRAKPAKNVLKIYLKMPFSRIKMLTNIPYCGTIVPVIIII